MRLGRLLAALAVAGAFLQAPVRAQQSPRVSIIDNGFTPPAVDIRPGDSVLWMYNTATRPHTVSSQSASPEQWDSGQMDPVTKPQFARTFNAPGTYPYYCKIHGRDTPAADPTKDPISQPCGMCGLVRVAGAASSAPTVTQAPAPTARTARTAAPTRAPGATVSPTPAVAAAAEPASPTPTSTATIAAQAPRDNDGGGGSGAPVAAAVALGALALGGAGYLAWRRRAMG